MPPKHLLCFEVHPPNPHQRKRQMLQSGDPLTMDKKMVYRLFPKTHGIPIRQRQVSPFKHVLCWNLSFCGCLSNKACFGGSYGLPNRHGWEIKCSRPFVHLPAITFNTELLPWVMGPKNLVITLIRNLHVSKQSLKTHNNLFFPIVWPS